MSFETTRKPVAAQPLEKHTATDQNEESAGSKRPTAAAAIKESKLTN